jgi:ADP-heptose:LPS heptosyltransferase
VRILALQLKRIGDLVLTAPALAALRRALPQAHIALAAYGGAAELLSAVPSISAGFAFGQGRGWLPWQQVFTGNVDVVLDFTGSDRSALATILASAPQRIAFQWVRKSGIRQLVYNEFVESAVRERHTVDHYADLLAPLTGPLSVEPGDERLQIPAATAARTATLLSENGLADQPFAIIHPGTARAEKYWVPERWAAVIRHLREQHGLRCVITGGTDPFELAHLRAIQAPADVAQLAGRIDLVTLAALVQRAALVVSCDTAIVHLASAFATPQVALFGPTNPFHWRPRHPAALVLSAAQPEAPLTDFQPRMKGAPTERISTAAVLHATDALLATHT